MLEYLFIFPIIGVLTVSGSSLHPTKLNNIISTKSLTLLLMVINLIISLLVFILQDATTKQFGFVSEKSFVENYFNLSLVTDNISLLFVLVITIIFPIALLSNWKFIKIHINFFLIILLTLQILLQLVFFIGDTLLYYVFFESILAPLFILIGLFGSNERIRASYYIFLYTLLGSLFMLLSIIDILSGIGVTEFLTVFKINFVYIVQFFLFIGIFIAFAVKTPVIYLNNWLLKAHVESPLSGSIILAAIVLKLSLYGIIRIILPYFPETVSYSICFIFTIGILTIIYASLSTIRITDIKELIAYSSVSHAAVYLLGIFSNVIQGIIGAIVLGIAHAFVSSGLFISAGGVLYDRCHTRLISYYRGISQIMPIFSILFFLLCLSNCGVPLSLNFVGEFTSLYGIFERLPVAGSIASLVSVVLSACYSIYMYNRIAFGGTFYKHIDLKHQNSRINEYFPDLTYREFFMLVSLPLFTLVLGIYPNFILDNISLYTYYLIFGIFISKTYNDSPMYINIDDNFCVSIDSSLLLILILFLVIINYTKNIFFDIKSNITSYFFLAFLTFYSINLGISFCVEQLIVIFNLNISYENMQLIIKFGSIGTICSLIPIVNIYYNICNLQPLTGTKKYILSCFTNKEIKSEVCMASILDDLSADKMENDPEYRNKVLEEINKNIEKENNGYEILSQVKRDKEKGIYRDPMTNLGYSQVGVANILIRQSRASLKKIEQEVKKANAKELEKQKTDNNKNNNK